MIYSQIRSVYNDLGIVYDTVILFVRDALGGGNVETYPFLKDYVEPLMQYKKIAPPGERSFMGLIKNEPELVANMFVTRLDQEREKFEELSDEEFESLKQEVISNPENLVPAKRREIGIRYDKKLQADLKDIQARKELEEWTKRKWQHRAGIIK